MHRASDITFAVLCCASILLGAANVPAAAGLNPDFTLPLHVKASVYEPCTGYLPVDCVSVRPTTTAPENEPIAIFVFVAHFTSISWVQAGLQWDPTWTYLFSLWDCQPGQLEGIFPDTPTTASGVTTFSCVTSPALAVIGHMMFHSGSQGCLAFNDPPYYPGISVGDCSLGFDRILDENSDRLGRICVGAPGHDACDLVVSVEQHTWGSIKASFGY